MLQCYFIEIFHYESPLVIETVTSMLQRLKTIFRLNVLVSTGIYEEADIVNTSLR